MRDECTNVYVGRGYESSAFAVFSRDEYPISVVLEEEQELSLFDLNLLLVV